MVSVRAVPFKTPYSFTHASRAYQLEYAGLCLWLPWPTHMIHSWAMVPTGVTPYFFARYTLEVPTNFEVGKVSSARRLMARSSASAHRRLRSPNSENAPSSYSPVFSFAILSSSRSL